MPLLLAFRSYVPGVRLRNVYSPLSLAVNLASKLVAVLVSVSSAPATTAPDGSVTAPLSVALLLCARPEIVMAANKRQKVRKEPNPEPLKRTNFSDMVFLLVVETGRNPQLFCCTR